jgi:hypothetical protein
MQKSNLEEVLTNWIKQATYAPGKLADGIDPAKWIAEKFVAWWQSEVEDRLADAELATAGVRAELQRLGGWENKQLGEALHELIHVSDALSDLRVALGLIKESNGSPEASG